MGLDLSRRRVSRQQRQETALARALTRALAEDPVADDEAGAERLIERALASSTPDGGARRAAPAGVPLLPVVRLDGLEVTQEIQDLSHTVPLVAGKATIVRAYLSRPAGAITLRGELLAARSPSGPWQAVASLGTARLDPSRSGTSPAQLRSRRADLGFSLNFRLPDDLVSTPGPLYLRMGRLIRAVGSGAVPSVAGVRRRRFTLGTAVPFRLRLVLLSYVQDGVTFTPSTTDVELLRSWLRRAYPVSRVELTTVTVPASAPVEFDASQVNAQLLALRAVDVATGTDARTHYYGMVDADGFFMRGLASDIPGTPQPGTVASGPAAASGFAWDTDGSYGDWYGAHELGHTLGRFHAEFCGAGGGAPYPYPNGQLSDADEAFVGIDTGDAALGLPLRVVPPVSSHDVMSYCDNQWLSAFTYTGIHDRLIAEDALPAGPAAALGLAAAGAAAPPGGSPTMRLIASLNLDRGTAEVAAVLPSSDFGGGDSPEAAGPDPAGEVAVRILAADDTVLEQLTVPLRRSACEAPDQEVTGTVDVDLPDPDGAARLQLLLNGAVVAEHPIGGAPAEPAAVRNDAPAFGAAPPVVSGGVLHLAWDAAAAPPSQRYAVQLSTDGGQSWQTVAVGLSEASVDLPVGHLPGDSVTVRVLATTGTGRAVVSESAVSLR